MSKHLIASCLFAASLFPIQPAFAFGGKPETKIEGLTHAQRDFLATHPGMTFVFGVPVAVTPGMWALGTPSGHTLWATVPGAPGTPLPAPSEYADPNSAAFDNFEFGPGLAGITYNLGAGQFGVADIITPFTLTRNNILGCYSSWQDKQGSWHHSSNFGAQAGILVTKPQAGNYVDVGITLVPYLYRSDLFAIGGGLAIRSINGSFSNFGANNLSLIMPITYQF